MNRQYLWALTSLGFILASTQVRAASADRFDTFAEEYERRHSFSNQPKEIVHKQRRIITSLRSQREESIERKLRMLHSKKRAKLIAKLKLRDAWKKFSLLDVNDDFFARRVSFDLSSMSIDSESDISSTCSHIAVCEDRDDSPKLVESETDDSSCAGDQYDLIAEEYLQQYAMSVPLKSTEKKDTRKFEAMQTQHKLDTCERERYKALSKRRELTVSRKRLRRTLSE